MSAFAPPAEVAEAADSLDRATSRELEAAGQSSAAQSEVVSANESVMEQPQSEAPLAASAAAEVEARVAPAEPAAAVAHAAPTATPAAPTPAPLKLEWPSDLVQIETDPQKARAAAVDEQPPAPRPRRVRPVPQALSNEPLVQVETRTRESAPAQP